MATAAGDSTGYGGGAGGKFRRRPFRKPQTTPYDRPPTALRITRRNDDSSSSGGWLSRIVDPASKLITASAHKLFSSVFRKRLLPPPQPSKDEDVEPLENHFGDAMAEVPSSIKERDTTEGNTQNGSMTDGVTGLANILKQKTFTRSEIDRLTALLHSREVIKTATQPPAGHSRQNEICGTAFENGFNPFEVSGADLTPAVRSNINVGDVASPTDLAKAYMGSMSTRVSPSTLGSRSQAVKEGTIAFTALASHRSSVSIMPKPLTPAVTSQKDFVVPKSRGRSAIYSMARTPYFKAQQTVNKDLGTYNDAFDGNPLSSSQKTLKRRSSALESYIGSVGPIRRIRQKPNLLYPKTLGLPSSCPPSTSATPSGVGEASSSKLHEERGEKGLLSSPHVSSQSIEMGQRILQQLEKLTPPKDKYNEKNPGFSGGISSMKLTPAMLSGQARKSLETVDSLKYVQGVEVCEKKVDSWNTFRETQYSITNEQDKFYNDSSKVLMNSSSNAYPENGEARSIDHDVIGDTNNTAPIVIKSTIGVPKKSPAFQMSAYEDDLDMDEDAYVTPSVNEGKIKLGASYAQSNGKLPEHPSLSEASKVDSPVLPEVESSSNSVLKNATIVEVSNTAEKGICHDKSDPVLNNTIGSSILSSQTVKISVAKNADFAASTVSPDLKSSDKASLPSFSTSSAAVSSVADVTSSSFAFGAASTHAAIKSPGSNNNSTDAVGLFKQADTAQTSVPGSSINTIGSFVPLSSTVPSPVMFSSPSPFIVSATKDGADGAINSATAATPVNGSSDNVKVSVAFPSFQSTFGGSSLTSDSAKMAAPGINTTEKSKETNLGNSTSSNLFGAASGHAQNSAASSFQFGAPVTSGAKSQLGATDKVSNGSIFGDQTLPSTTASVSTTERVTCQTASSLPSGSAPISSSFAFGSSSPGSSSAFSFGKSSMSAPANGSSTTVAFGSSSTSTAAAPSGSASSGFTFGTSSISAPACGASNGGSAASSSLFGFGASSSTPSTSPSSTLLLGTSAATASSSSPTSTFSFGASPATATSSAPSSSTFSFGSSLTSSSIAPSSSTFISGASSVPPASSSGLPSTFSFGVSPASSSAPSSTFAFGASPASSSAPSSTFAFGASLASSSAPSSTFAFGASPTSSSAPSSTFSFGASPTSSSAPSSTFSFGASPTSSSAPSSTFSFGASPTSSSAPSSTFSFGASPTSSSAPSSTFSFGASPTSSSALSSTFSFGASPASSSAPSPAFSFGSSSAPTSSNATPSAFLFGASSASATTTTTAPVFPFGSAAPSTAVQPSQPAFGNSPMFGFGSTPSPSGNNNDQMSMEDSMVEDSMHQSPTMATPNPVFGQIPTNNFSFGMAQPQAPAQAQLGASPFQFGGQQNQVAASPNPFQASGSFDGGSFSLGAGGNDKSNRRIVKVKGRNRKK